MNAEYATVQIATTPEDRELCLSVRYEVFVDEQKVPIEEELDAYDDVAVHFLARLGSDSQPVGTARLILLPNGHGKVGRVAVRRVFRRYGVGAAIMEALENSARERGINLLVLDAQLHAIPFYQSLGYRVYGPVFLDAAIEHRAMDKVLE
jgi:predicted GNAT family N-acyltransferase